MKLDKNDKKVEKLFKKISKENRASGKFKRELLSKLKEQHRESNPASGSFFTGILKFKMQFASACAVLVFTSTTMYAYNSPNVTQGHILYPIKRSVEEVEATFVNTPEEQIEYYNKMALRRLEEVEVLEAKNIFDESTLIAAESYVQKAEEVKTVATITKKQEEDTEVIRERFEEKKEIISRTRIAAVEQDEDQSMRAIDVEEEKEAEQATEESTETATVNTRIIASEISEYTDSTTDESKNASEDEKETYYEPEIISPTIVEPITSIEIEKETIEEIIADEESDIEQSRPAESKEDQYTSRVEEDSANEETREEEEEEEEELESIRPETNDTPEIEEETKSLEEEIRVKIEEKELELKELQEKLSRAERDSREAAALQAEIDTLIKEIERLRNSLRSLSVSRRFL